MRKTKRKVEPAPVQTDMAEGVPVKSHLGGDEVLIHRDGTNVDEEPEAEDASSMLPDTPVNTQMKTENRAKHMYADSIKSLEEAAKIGSLSESPW